METAQLWAAVGDALDEANVPLHLRDQIDNALCDLVRAERADVLENLYIGIKRPENRDLEAIVRRPLG